MKDRRQGRRAGAPAQRGRDDLRGRCGWARLAGVVVGLLVSLAIAACGQASAAGEPVAPPRGGATIYSQQCASCHGDRTGAGATAGSPSHGPTGHTWHHSDVQLRSIILDGGPFQMPAFRGRLDAGDIDAVLAYIKTWWTDDQRQTQARISAGAP